MNIENYLRRLNYNGNLDPTPELLGKLQEVHLLNIPFENLDIHYGVPIVLDIDKIYGKIILNQRGGFCYELNGLFYELLISLGFNAKRISAKVFDKATGYGPEYDHLAILADIDGSWYLSDVGFGEFSFTPLKLETGIMQKDKRGNFIIGEFGNDYFVVSKAENNILLPQYIFKTRARELNEFKDMCHYHQTSPHSHFTRDLLVSRPTLQGRITLTQASLKIKMDDSINETPLENNEAFIKMLWKYFDIHLKDPPTLPAGRQASNFKPQITKS